MFDLYLSLQDIIFVIQEKKHENFTREGNDLVYTLRVDLKDILKGVILI